VQLVASKHGIEYFATLQIVASNDLNEATILSLNQQGHEIDVFGIGTNLVTCQAQPALGCVYKLVEVRGLPRIKLSQEIDKVNLPGRKLGYRLYNAEGTPVIDYLTVDNGKDYEPKAGERFLCRHPFLEHKRAYITPSRVEPLYRVYFENGQVAQHPLPSLQEVPSLSLSLSLTLARSLALERCTIQ